MSDERLTAESIISKQYLGESMTPQERFGLGLFIDIEQFGDQRASEARKKALEDGRKAATKVIFDHNSTRDSFDGFTIKTAATLDGRLIIGELQDAFRRLADSPAKEKST